MTGSAAHGSAARHETLLAPVRTRLAAPTAPVNADLQLLPPVLSGLFGRPTQAPAPARLDPGEPAALEPAPTAELPLIAEDEPVETVESVVDWFGEDESDPWEEIEPAESSELILDLDEEAGDLVLEAAAEGGGDDDVALSDDAGPPMVRPAPTPLSPWDLGAGSAGTEAAKHAARARAEWQSLGEALTGSLSVDSPARQPRGAHEIELTDEIVASLEAQTGDSYSPFANLNSPRSYSGPPGRGGDMEAPGGGKRAALSDLARRLEAFAAQIRAEGPEALARAQREGDGVDALLAGIAAGFIAGRGE